jgi:hypothetical protein
MFKSGDKFIRFTDYGTVSHGEVKSYVETRVIDKKNGVIYVKPHIVVIKNNREFVLELDSSNGKIYKIEKEFSSEEAKKL